MGDLLVCSHRGPYSFSRTKRGFESRRGGGGLVGALLPVLAQRGGTWVSSAANPGPARPFEKEGFRVVPVRIPAALHNPFYDEISNQHLWFAFHYLFDPASAPLGDATFYRTWDAYREVNQLFAEAVDEALGNSTQAILIEDYHLLLVASKLKSRTAPVFYFHHTPWCEPGYLALLPAGVIEEILRAMLTCDSIGFHARRWKQAFLRCIEAFVPQASVGDSKVTLGGHTVSVVVAPAPLDTERLNMEASDPATSKWMQRLEKQAAGRRVIARVDRVDLSKNALRGFLAFEELLESRKDLRDEVWFAAVQYPSRLSVDRYRRYVSECRKVVRRINERFGPAVTWSMQDDFHHSLAALQISDVLLVNPVYDGLNLVAKEGAALNRRDGSLVLSRNAGVFEELIEHCYAVNPFDVSETAQALADATEAPKAIRHQRALNLKKISNLGTPLSWLAARGIS